mgnify:CR=1 FL=1
MVLFMASTKIQHITKETRQDILTLCLYQTQAKMCAISLECLSRLSIEIIFIQEVYYQQR